MATFPLNLGLDFLYARLHGWWSRSATGPVLEELTRAATEENFFHLLQNRGVWAVTGPERVLEQFILRQYERLGQLAARVDGPFHAYLELLQHILERENYKTILNYRFFPEREAHLNDALVRFPGAEVSENDLLTLLDATTDEQFLRLFLQTTGSPRLTEIARQLSQDRDLMRAECAVDNDSYQEELAAIRRLHGEARQVLLSLKGQQIDHVNITTLLRNANFYHLDAKGLSYAWVEGGRELSRRLFDHLADATSSAQVIQALPAFYQHVLAGESDASSTRLDHLLHCQLARQAREHFYHSASPRQALAVYPILLEQETLNLSRIYEGIRFNLPAADIAAMMIR